MGLRRPARRRLERPDHRLHAARGITPFAAKERPVNDRTPNSAPAAKPASRTDAPLRVGVLVLLVIAAVVIIVSFQRAFPRPRRTSSDPTTPAHRRLLRERGSHRRCPGGCGARGPSGRSSPHGTTRRLPHNKGSSTSQAQLNFVIISATWTSLLSSRFRCTMATIAARRPPGLASLFIGEKKWLLLLPSSWTIRTCT